MATVTGEKTKYLRYFNALHGEFGPGDYIGPSPTNMKPRDIMQALETRDMG